MRRFNMALALGVIALMASGCCMRQLGCDTYYIGPGDACGPSDTCGPAIPGDSGCDPCQAPSAGLRGVPTNGECGPRGASGLCGGHCGHCGIFGRTIKAVGRVLQGTGGLFHPVCWCGSACGERYWGDDWSYPPDCVDPCDTCGNFVGPQPCTKERGTLKCECPDGMVRGIGQRPCGLLSGLRCRGCNLCSNSSASDDCNSCSESGPVGYEPSVAPSRQPVPAHGPSCGCGG